MFDASNAHFAGEEGLKDMQPGDRVLIRYVEENGKRTARSVIKAARKFDMDRKGEPGAHVAPTGRGRRQVTSDPRADGAIDWGRTRSDAGGSGPDTEIRSKEKMMNMIKMCVVFLACLFLASCTVGPVHMAKTEDESIKNSYEETQLKNLYDKNKPLLHDIYVRLKSNQINIYREGIGFTTLRDPVNGAHYYLMVNVRPPEIVFDESTSKPEQRYSKVMGTYVEKYLTYVKKSDIDSAGVEGLSFGVYWPVRDYSQCKENGGFLEYVIVHLSKDDLNSLYNKKRTFADVAAHTDVIASLDLKAPTQMTQGRN